jgi:uracil-DNA glycosylase
MDGEIRALERFPFGAPVVERGTDAPDGHRPVVVVGAYPSALHVRWSPPPGFGATVVALPVDNEPTPFWDGQPTEAQGLFDAWHQRYFDSRWGEVWTARLNGPSGQELESRWLRPFGYGRADAFITDCLTTARSSTGVARRLEDRYQRVVAELGAPTANLGHHPSENNIVQEALAEHSQRLVAQVSAAKPELVITLGNAAARVLGALSGSPAGATLHVDTYGKDRHIRIAEVSCRWQALIHPAAPHIWQRRHEEWRRLAGPSLEPEPPAQTPPPR